MIRTALLLLSLALAVPAGAEEPPRPVPPDLAETGEDLTPEQWREIAAGRTVWYRIGEAMWGRERYAMSEDRVIFQFPDGECVEGTWTYSAPWFCFDFGEAMSAGGPHCFRHLRHEGRLFALGMMGEPQEVVRIDATPLACGPDVTS